MLSFQDGFITFLLSHETVEYLQKRFHNGHPEPVFGGMWSFLKSENLPCERNNYGITITYCLFYVLICCCGAFWTHYVTCCVHVCLPRICACQLIQLHLCLINCCLPLTPLDFILSVAVLFSSVFLNSFFGSVATYYCICFSFQVRLFFHW